MNEVRITSGKANGLGSFTRRYKYAGVAFTRNAKGDNLFRVRSKAFRTLDETTAFIDTLTKGN